MNYGLKRRRGRTYISGIDWDMGGLFTSTDRDAAKRFASVAEATELAKEYQLDANNWKVVKFT